MTEPETNSAVATPATATPRPSPALEDAQRFVAELEELRERDRGRIAQLRRNAGETLPGRGTAWVYGYLYAPRRQRYAEIYFLVATLFDLNRKRFLLGDFGRTMRRMVTGTSEESLKRRFRILLDATFDRIHDPLNESAPWQEGGGELAFRLRQMVKLLASKEVGVDWAPLLVDVCQWSRPDKRVQKKWARSFFDEFSVHEADIPTAAKAPSEPPNE